MSLEKSLQDTGFAFTPILDGTIHRFDRNGKTGNAWFIGNQYFSSWGDWVTGEKHSEESALALEPGAKEKIEELKANLLQEKKSRQLEAAENARYIWESNKNCFSHPYLTKKKVKAYGLKVSMSGDLIIPIYDSKGELCSLQFISSDGSKRFLPGGKLSGSYYMIGDQESSTVYLCEGYATGASILESLIVEGVGPSACVYIAFNANNLPKVAESLKHWAKEVIICADNDSLTPGNPGVTKAEEALAVLFGSCEANIKVPAFTAQEAESKNTDFNDLHNLHGLEAVKSTLAGVRSIPKEPEPIPVRPNTNVHNGTLKEVLKEIIPLPANVKKTKDGEVKVIPLSQQTLADKILSYFGDTLIREGRDVFKWVDTHWTELDPTDFKFFCIQAAQKLARGSLKNGFADDVYKLVLAHMNAVPFGQSFYKQLPNVCNFLDGTLWLDQRKKKLEFKNHYKSDLITWVLPHEYKAPRPKNPIFETWLERTFQGDPKKEEKIRALKQLGGSCLIPVNPCTGFFFGPAGTGKSTFALICHNFVGEENLSTVSPDEMRDNKQKETMINKRVNINTDIGDGRLDGGLLKRITDKKGISVNRMYKVSIIARLPYLHLFCGNHLPKGIDGISNAMDRRISIIEFKNVLGQGDMRGDYDQEIMDAGPGAVLDFMEEGLRDLVKNGGFYENPGKDILKEWKLENDFVGQFLDEIAQGNIPEIEVKEGAKMRQFEMWNFFERFNGKQAPRISRRMLYKRVRDSFPTVTVHGFDYFSGLKVRGAKDEAPGGQSF